MPQLSPMMGFMMSFFVMFFFLMLMCTLSKKSPIISKHKMSKSLKKSFSFFK